MIYIKTSYVLFGSCWKDTANTIPYDLTNIPIVCEIKRTATGIISYTPKVVTLANEYAAVIPCEMNVCSGIFVAIFKLHLGKNKCYIVAETKPFTILNI